MGDVQKMSNFNRYLMESCFRICNDKEIAKILLDTSRNPLAKNLDNINLTDELLWKHVYPYSFIPDTAELEICTIMIDLDNFRLDRTHSVKRGYLTIDILCHEKLMRTIQGTRAGMLIHRIDELFNGVAFSKGASRLKFYQAEAWNRQPRQYIGYKIVYELLDVN